MIKVVRVLNEEKEGKREVSFILKTSRYVWLSSDRLTLGYPLNFSNLTNLGDVAVYNLLPIAFFEHADISLPPGLPVEQGIQERVDAITKVWNQWYKSNRRIKIRAENVTPQDHLTDGKKQAAQLFSGGVDSFSTFCRHENPIRYLILFQGSDIFLSQAGEFERIQADLADFARENSKELIVISTNVRFLSEAPWMYLVHGCAMLAPLLALSNYINRAYISSSFSGAFGIQIPWGSHLHTDIHIRTQAIEVIHDGFELSRPKKMQLLIDKPDILKRIRVCGHPTPERFNCGKCEKCYRTLTALTLLGVQPELLPFPKESVDFEKIADFLEGHVLRPGLKDLWTQNLELLEGSEIADVPYRDKLNWGPNLELFEQSRNGIKGKEKLRQTLLRILDGFTEEYKTGIIKDLPYRDKVNGAWHKLEERLRLPYDSLGWIRKSLRARQGSYHKEFIRAYRCYQQPSVN